MEQEKQCYVSVSDVLIFFYLPSCFLNKNKVLIYEYNYNKSYLIDVLFVRTRVDWHGVLGCHSSRRCVEVTCSNR